MGSTNFDFLTESLLFDEQRLDDKFANVPIADLKAELARYREYCIENYGLLQSEINTQPNLLNIFFDDPSGTVPLERAALYADQCVLEDPLISRSQLPSGFADSMNQMMEAPEDPDWFKEKLAKAASDMKRNTPLVVTNFLKYFPTSFSFEGPKEIPLLSSKNGFEDILPSKLLQKLKDAAKVTSLEMLGQGRFRILDKRTLTRTIDIEFDDLAFGGRYGYTLFESDFKVVNEEERLVRTAMTLPKTPPNPDFFQAWVKQSINQAAHKFYTRGLFASQLASSLGCVYSTRSDLLFSILPRTTSDEGLAVAKNADLFMNLELPFLEGLTAEDLVQLRVEEGEAFANFRIALDGRLRALQDVDDPEKASRLAKQSLYDMSAIQGNELKNKLKSIQEKFGWNALLMAAGILGSVQTSGFSLGASFLAAKGVGESIIEYRKEVKRHPAYFLWKLNKRKR